MTLTTAYASERAEALMGTMCKHFGHKIPVADRGDHAVLDFGTGLAVLRASDGVLHIALEADSTGDGDRLREVLESHLLRFAHREDPAPLVWAAD